MLHDRIACPQLLSRVMSADDAASLIAPSSRIGMSGFTAAGYPKAVPLAMARRIEDAHGRGEKFAVQIWSGASTGPELDGALAKADGIEFRMPYNSDPTARDKINSGKIEYLDMHLSQVAPMVWEGFLGTEDIAVIEVTGIRADGSLIPSTSVGNNKTWIDRAQKVILEVNRWQNPALEGMHDIYYGTALPPHRVPIPLVKPDDRIGEPWFRCDPDKVIAVVETDAPDRNQTLPPPDTQAQAIAGHLLEFLHHEVSMGRLPSNLLPLQSGVGSVANAVLAGLQTSSFPPMTAFTEVIQDSILDLQLTGKLASASSAALCLGPEAMQRLTDNMAELHDRIILRPQEISNHPELIRRLGCIAMNGMIEADIYGNVNSTHVMGSRIMNGIGGSGDYARNAYISIFTAPSTARNGAISTIVPHVSHVDHITQDVQVLVTDQGLADMRGLSPKRRASLVIENCAHPDFRPLLKDYFDRALRESYGLQTPTLLSEALSWHQRFIDSGSMHV